MQQLIYISGPYSAPTAAERLANTYRAIDAANACIRKGHLAFVPHLTHWQDERAREQGQTIVYEYWMNLDLRLLEAFDALLYLGQSKGADMEYAQARELGLRIYRSIDEVEEVG